MLIELVAENQDTEGCQQFIKTWHKDMCSKLASNSPTILGCCYGTLAAKISSLFPSSEALELYVNHIMSWLPGYIPPDTSTWQPCEPTIHEITFSIHHLRWMTGKDLLNDFVQISGAVYAFIYLAW